MYKYPGIRVYLYLRTGTIKISQGARRKCRLTNDLNLQYYNSMIYFIICMVST